MTAEFGPNDNDPDGGFTYRMAGWWLSVVCAVLPTPDSAGVRFDPEADRLSVRGESESAGSGYQAGQFSVMFSLLAAVVAMGFVVITVETLQLAVGTAFELPALALMGVIGVTAIWTIGGLFERINSMEVVDHRTEPSREFDDLTQQYVDGEIDTDELEAQTEARLE